MPLDDPHREDYVRLSSLNLLRAIVKKAIMTVPYNVSTIQMIKYIRENFELSKDESEPVNNDNSNEFNYRNY
jgi:hypothetical protein